MTADELNIREIVAQWLVAMKSGDTETVLSLMANDSVSTLVDRAARRRSARAISGRPVWRTSSPTPSV